MMLLEVLHVPSSLRQNEHVFLQYYSSRSLCRLLLLAEEVLSGFLITELSEISARCIGTHAEKVLWGLLHCGVQSVVDTTMEFKLL